MGSAALRMENAAVRPWAALDCTKMQEGPGAREAMPF